MRARHDDAGPEKCDVVVALGGDGFMLSTLHAFLGKDKPIYGMNAGSVGFLMNTFSEDDLPAEYRKTLRWFMGSTILVILGVALSSLSYFRS